MKPHTNRRTTWLSTRLTTVLCLVGAMIAFTCYGSARAASPPSKAKPLTVKWLDVTTVLLDDGQDAILVDGYFSRYPVEQVLEGQIGPDVVLAAHSHLDHALDTPVVAARTGAVVAGSESTANIARGLNFPESRIHVVKDREVLRYGDFKITVIQSPHSPGDLAQGSSRPQRRSKQPDGSSFSMNWGHGHPPSPAQSGKYLVHCRKRLTRSSSTLNTWKHPCFQMKLLNASFATGTSASTGTVSRT